MSNFELIENYIYLYHLDKFILLPVYPESVTDTLTSTFLSSTPLARSAPIYSYSHSGPRSLQINLALHRDLMYETNYNTSNINLELGEDYVDTMIKELQAIAMPKYNASIKMVNPPMIALRLGNEIYVKGIVNGGITVTYSGPLLNNNKYACVNVGFTVTEVDPYDATTVAKDGSFRGLNKSLERRLYK